MPNVTVTINTVAGKNSLTLGPVNGAPDCVTASGDTITVNPQPNTTAFAFTVAPGTGVTFTGITMPPVNGTSVIITTPDTVNDGANTAYAFNCTDSIPDTGTKTTAPCTVTAKGGATGGEDENMFPPYDPTLLLNPIGN